MKRGPREERLPAKRCKPQAPSCKPQARDASCKLQATSSNNSQISSQLREDHGPWPLDISSWIEDPGISFTEHGPGNMPRNLMRRKSKFVSLCDF